MSLTLLNLGLGIPRLSQKRLVRFVFSSYIEGLVAVIEIVLLFAFSIPIWSWRVSAEPAVPIRAAVVSAMTATAPRKVRLRIEFSCTERGRNGKNPGSRRHRPW